MGRQKKHATPLDPVRRRLLQLLAAKGSNLRTASIAMDRNDAYLQQSIRKEKPRVLAEEDRETLAEQTGAQPRPPQARPEDTGCGASEAACREPLRCPEGYSVPGTTRSRRTSQG